MIQQKIITQQIITQARTWLGTKFQHQGRVKSSAGQKGGCDCLGLIVGVAKELGLKDTQGGLLYLHDSNDYARQPDGVILQRTLEACFHPVPLTEIQPADVVLFRFEHEPQHVGLVTNCGIIHCYAAARKVVEHRLDDLWCGRIVAVYRFAEIAH